MGRRDLDYDEVLRYIGQFGTFQVVLAKDSAEKVWDHKSCQKRIFFWLWLVSAGGGLAVMVFAFTGIYFSFTHIPSHYNDADNVLHEGLEPRYRCRVPECELSNSSTYTQAGREGLLPSWYVLMINNKEQRFVYEQSTAVRVKWKLKERKKHDTKKGLNKLII